MSNYTTTPIYNSHFNRWMPLSGVYIAGATFVCVIAVVADLIMGFCRGQLWLPSSWSSVNAASITVISAASKLTLDLSTSMPRQIDQLSKLSTSTFVCIALATVAPSIGKLKNDESPANIAALCVFVLSSVVGLCIQLTNGVIFAFKPAHITTVVMMSILLVKCVASVEYISLYKKFAQVKYDTQHRQALKDVEDRKHLTTEKLKWYLQRFSMMAHSGCPQSRFAQRGDGALYALCGLVAAIAFLINLIACIAHKDKFLGPTSGSGTSSFGWSVLYILISQTIGICVGTIVLCIRGYNVLSIQSKKEGLTLYRKRNTKAQEKYWMENFMFLPFLPYIEYRQQKGLKYLMYVFCVGYLCLKMLLLWIDFLWRRPPLAIWACILYVMPGRPHRGDDKRVKELGPYFLQVFGSLTKTDEMMKCISVVSEKCLGERGRETKHLRKLLQKCHSDGFDGVVNFRIPAIKPGSDEPPNSWALSVLALTWIATALPNIKRKSMDKLIMAVAEGLVYVKLIEDEFNNEPEFISCRSSASTIWLKFEMKDKTGFSLGRDLKDHSGEKTAKETLVSIKESARSILINNSGDPSSRFVKEHYLYGTCEMILEDCENDRDDPDLIFDKLRHTISDILGACLVNLKSYFLQQCNRCSSIEKRREAACDILKLFAETEEIMKILEKRQLPDIPPKDMVRMDSWCLSRRHCLRQVADWCCCPGCNIL